MPVPNYRSVKDVYDELKDAGVVSETLPEWSDKMNQLTKSDLFSAGLHDNVIKRASVGVDRMLESTGLPQASERLGASIGAGLGAREAGASIGRSLPRATANMASFLIPGAGWANAARLGLAGLMTGAESYTETGSPASGVIGGATAVALPGIAGAGERLAGKYGFGKVGQFFAGQATAAGAIEGEKATESLVRGEVPENPLSVANLLNLTLGQVPFAAIHGTNKLIGKVVGPSPDTVNHAVEAAEKVQIQNESPRTESAPPDPTVIRETQQRLAQLRGEQVRLDPTNVEEANRLLQEEHSTLQQHVPTASSVFGDTIAPDSPREQVVGKELKSNGKWRAIEVADLPVNPEELRGKVVTYSTAYEPNPSLRSDGHTVFGLPDAQWRTVKNSEEWNQRKTQIDPNQPDLPQQETPATNVFAHLQDLKKVEIDVDTASTPADMQKAVVRLQGVQHENGIPPTNDATIRPLVEELTKAGDKSPVQTAVKIETKRTARLIQEPPLSPEEAADISARMGGQGFSVVGEDKLSHKLSERPQGRATPFGNIVEEAAYAVTAPHVGARPEDVQMFRTLVGELGKTSDISSEEISDVAEFIANRDGVPVAEAKDEVTNFLSQPHAKEWEQQLEAKVQLMREKNASPDRPPSLEAGKGWLFSLAPYDAERNILGGKHTLPKSGVVDEAALRNMGGTGGKPLTKAEMELYRTIAPEAFDGTKVDVRKLVKGLREKGPVVEVKKLGDVQNETVRMENEAQHRIETLGYTIEREMGGDIVVMKSGEIVDQEEIEKLPRNVQNDIELVGQRAFDRENREGDNTRFSFVGPKPESDMPGYVEGLVRVPIDTTKAPTSPNVKYSGPHFGSEDTNVLSFYRGYEETLPNGEKAFHVIEMQSDWGQRVRDQKRTDSDPYETEHGQRGVANHPLLRVYESLALKAAIQHAKEVGATRVILSDAETAMMTQGHDRVGRQIVQHGPNEFFLSPSEGTERGYFATREEAQAALDAAVKEPPQSKGMRLHYDQTLPSAMEKLTGGKGEKVEMGLHKSTQSLRSEQTGVTYTRDQVQGSPVFRDPSGAPKTQITGRVYDISNLPSEFTLTEPNRAPGDFTPFVPETPTDINKVNEIGKTGMELHKILSKSTDLITKATFEGLKPFTDALGRIEVEVGSEKNTSSSHAWNLGNGRTRIVLTPELLSAPPERMYSTIAHELVHGVTIAEMDNPTKKPLVDELDALRHKLAANLPPSMQKAYNRAINENWYGKWVRGEVIWDTIFFTGTNQQRQVLYGLMTTKEMVAQGLSRKSMQEFMKGIKADRTFNGFSKFVDTVKRMLGFGIKGTAFEEFLSQTGALVEHGNYVASFREFSERYFENQGLSDSMVQGNTRRALSLVIGSEGGTTKEDIFTQLGQDVSVRSPELNTAKRKLNNALDKTRPEFVETEQLMGELGFEPSVAGHDDFVHEALMGREARFQDALDMMSPEGRAYVFAKVNDMQSVLGVLRAATEEYNRGLINIADPKVLSGPVRDAFKAAERIVQVQKVHELGEQLVQESMAMSPDTYLERAPDFEKVLADFGNDDPQKPGFFIRNLTQMSRIVRKFPVTAELADRVYELGPNAANMKSNILRVLGIDLRSGSQALSKEGLETSTKAISTPRTLKAVDKWMFWNNKVAQQDKGGATMLPTSHPEIQKLLNGLNPGERQGVIDTVAKQVLSNQTAQSEVLEKMHQIGSLMGAHIVMKDSGLKTKESLDLAGQMFTAVAADRTNPQLAQQADAQLAVVQGRMSPEGFLELLKYTQAEVEKFNGWKQYFDANPAWGTAQRLERYLVSFTRGKKKLQLQASSVKEANELAKGGQHLEVIDQWKSTEDEFPVLGPDAEQWFSRAAELEGNQLRSLVNKGYLDQAGADDFARMSPVTQQQREVAAAKSGIPRFDAPARLLSQGAEELPWFWNHVAHAERISNFWSRKLLRAQSSLHLADPDLVANPELQSMMKQHVESVLKPDPALTTKITRFVSTWFMGFSPASAMMNGFQTITTAVPELTSLNGGRILDSYNKWGRAVREVTKQALPGGKWSTPDHEWLYKKLSESHDLDFSMFSDEAATQEAAHFNFKRMMMKQKPQDLGQKISSAAGIYTNVGMWMFKSVERTNNKIASLMAFDHYISEGMSREDALVETRRFNRSVNYGGGRANRPVGAFSGEGDSARTIAMLATNMQGYNLGVVGQIADYLQRGFFRPQGITPAEVYSARKAGLQMMSTQLIAAGALGLPFVSGVLALLNQLFPNLEANRHVREWASDFFKGDRENGETLGEIALTGLPSILGWDMQSRLSIGNVVPGVSEYNGFQPEQLLGPPANLVANFVNGVARVATGDPKGGRNFVPPGVRHLFDGLASLTGEKLKDYKDRPLFTPSLGESAGMALGFQPKKLSDFNAANRIAQQNQEVSNRRSGQFHQQMAEEVLKGNFGTVRQTLNARASQDKSFDVRATVRQIAQAGEDLTFPRDLRREGTKNTSEARGRLLSTFNLPPSEPSEVDRLKLRLQVQERLGLRTDPRQELREAELVDELQRTNPTATRSQLRQQVSGLLRRHRQTSPLLPE